MPDLVPTVYTEHGPPDDDERVVLVRLPADVADELVVATLWLSLQLRHQVPINVLRRALVINGVDRASHVLAELRRTTG